MPFSKEDLHLIKGLRESKNYSSRQFLQEFPEKHWTRSALDKLLRKISVTGSVDRDSGSGRRRSARTEENVAVSTLGRSHLVFIDPGVKINGSYYRDVLLSQHLLLVIRNLAPEGCFVFQQASAPAHRARETIKMLTRETPDFISQKLWPPNSPYLNPVDYKVWSDMQER